MWAHHRPSRSSASGSFGVHQPHLGIRRVVDSSVSDARAPLTSSSGLSTGWPGRFQLGERQHTSGAAARLGPECSRRCWTRCRPRKAIAVQTISPSPNSLTTGGRGRADAASGWRTPMPVTPTFWHRRQKRRPGALDSAGQSDASPPPPAAATRLARQDHRRKGPARTIRRQRESWYVTA
jgi:hypothetical protein